MSPTQQPLVSVVIPTYNRADLIPRAIASVSSQSYQNFEIIVVDDNSQDDTEKVVREIANQDSRISYHRHSSNLGGSAARNTGIKQATGKYIAFLDSDDIWLPQKLELQLKAIAKNLDPERIVSYTKFKKSSRVFYFPSVLPRRGKKDNETIADYFWLGGGEVLTSTLLVSRSLAAKHLFKVGLPKHQDLDFVLRLEYADAKFVFVPQVLTIWHNESRSDRISRSADYQLSLDWIESYRDKISERSYKGFLLKEVVPNMLQDKRTKTEAIKLLVRGFFQRTVSINLFLFLIIQQGIPRQYQNYLKILFNKIKLIKNV